MQKCAGAQQRNRSERKGPKQPKRASVGSLYQSNNEKPLDVSLRRKRKTLAKPSKDDDSGTVIVFLSPSSIFIFLLFPYAWTLSHVRAGHKRKDWETEISPTQSPVRAGRIV
ncbi:hypothetical protein AMECASPLE_006299 [Ameca splendens]|uniref:Uncharacterized protein n=1 Tax=Ameca splendens TaxID=208324 RepID=A0ABV0Z8L7_9TELE